ncbi:MAG: lysylphosphatidylglycerol synthase transmembrane domain-containing protein [Candidatus Heimdallarchaeaceae archaeon]
MKTRLISILISVGLLASLVYFSDVKKIIEILSKVNLSYILFGFFLWFLEVILRTARWQYILKKININIPFIRTFKIFIPSVFISNLTPGKAGEPIRSVLLKKIEDKSISTTLSSIFLERMFDVIAAVTISIVGVFLLMATLPQISLWLILIIFIYTVLLAITLFIIISEKRTRKIILKLCSLFSFVPKIKKMRSKIDGFSLNLHKSFMEYKEKKILFFTAIFSISIWVLDGVIFFIVFKSLGLSVSFISTIVVIPIAALIGVLSFLPGGLGSNEIVMVLFFIALFPLTVAEVTTAVLLGRFFSFWIYVFIGSIMLSTVKYRYKL